MDVRTKGISFLMWNKKKWGILEWVEFLLRVVVATAVVVLFIISWLWRAWHGHRN